MISAQVLLTYLALVCAPIEKINQSGLAWNDHDEKILKSAKTRCQAHFKGYPCVKLFIKTEVRNYRVVCSKMQEE